MKKLSIQHIGLEQYYYLQSQLDKEETHKMGIGFFIVGGAIFAAYMGLTIFNIIYSNRKQREENYPSLPKVADEVDMDGHGNYGRFPNNHRHLGAKSRIKQKEELK